MTRPAFALTRHLAMAVTGGLADDMAIFAHIAARKLLPTERRVARFRMRWIVMWPALAQTVAGIAALVLLAYVTAGVPVIGLLAWFLAVVLVARLWWRVLSWFGDIVMLTPNRLARVSGVIDTKLVHMPLSKITDMDYNRSVLGHLLGYGSFRFESAGQKQGLEFIRFVPKPDAFYEALLKLEFPATSGGEMPEHRDGGTGEPGSSLDDLSNEWPEDRR